MSKTQQRDPLAPIEFVVTVTVALLGFLLAFLFFNAATGRGSFSSSHCVSITNGTAAYLDSATASITPGYETPGEIGPGAIPSGAQVTAETLLVCAKHPSGGQVAWLRLHDVPGAVFGIATLVLVLRLIRRARRLGFFTLPVSRGLQGLGWYLIVGSLVVDACAGIAKSRFLVSVLPGYNGMGGLNPNLPWSLLITGAGIVTLGRVMARAVLMQEELDTTV